MTGLFTDRGCSNSETGFITPAQGPPFGHNWLKVKKHTVSRECDGISTLWRLCRLHGRIWAFLTCSQQFSNSAQGGVCAHYLSLPWSSGWCMYSSRLYPGGVCTP